MFFISIFLSNSLAKGQSFCEPADLKTDHLENPIGLDNLSPRFSWKIKDNRVGARQVAYRVIVGTDSLNVLNGNANQWDTGKKMSDEILLTYSGKLLERFTKYYWKVIVWDKEQKECSSFVSSFEMGMMNIKDWQGAWISDGRDMNFEPAPYFRKRFSIRKTIKSARAYIAVAGLYELYVNGEKIGNHRLDPMYTRFDRRNLYITYDITNQLKAGDNALGVILGNGWYNHQSKAVWDFDRAPWRNRPAFCMDVRITYLDGSTEIIPTDLSWKTLSGGLIFNSIYTGEHFDARLEPKGWSTADFDDSKCNGVSYRAVPSNNVSAQQVCPIRNVLAIPAKSINKIDDKTYVFDFGQNMSGATKIKIQGEEGTEVRIKHGERLYPNGHVDMSNIDVYYRGDVQKNPFQTDILYLSGGGEDEFMPKFNYKGFRYVEVTSSKSINLDKNSITAYFMHSDVLGVGEINSSDELVNRLWWVTNNAYLSNLMGYPTDCPQREKNGWTGDAHFAIETALYNYDAITIYEKWLADHRDEQQPNGVLPDIIPTGGWGYGTDNGLDWTSTIALIPWNIYLFYGDSKLLKDCYENIKRYVDYVNRISPNRLTSWGRGDWVPVKSQSNKELTSSVYFYVDTKILANAAKLFGKEQDYKYYTSLADKIRDAINNKFLNKETGVYANGSQTEQSVPLQWKVVPEEMVSKVAQNLAQKVIGNGYHLDVGVLGAKAILNALSENGFTNVAFKVAAQNTYPSWGWWVVNGATTLHENWDLKAKRDISDNHMMFGEIGGWLFKGLGGIFPDPEHPGFKNTILRPGLMKELKSFSAKFNSPYGTIESKWNWEKKNIVYEVNIPANSTAILYLPDFIEGSRIIKLEAGKHRLILKTLN